MDDQRAPQNRPAFPVDAVRWLVGDTPRTVVVLGRPDIAAAFEAAGHDVTALARDAAAALPRPDRSLDVVVAAHGLPDDLTEIARVLRPGGRLALVWNERDGRIPWARKLDALLGSEVSGEAPETPVVTSALFGFVEEKSFRYWQVVTGETLEEMVCEELAGLSAEEREAKVADARALYDDYGRGHDGMQMPWVSRCFKAAVVESAWASPRGLDDADKSTQEPATGRGDAPEGTSPPSNPPTDPPVDQEDADLLLIDFR